MLNNLTIANHITEEYDDGDWHIRKYANGRCKASTSQQYNMTINNAGGFGYFVYRIFDIPNIFETVTERYITCMSTYPLAYSVTNASPFPTNNEQISIGVYCPISTTRNVTYNIMVYGTYK